MFKSTFVTLCAALACFSLSGCGAYVDALARAHSGSPGDWPDLFIVPRDGLPCFYADRSWLVASFTVKEARPGTTVLWEMPARDWQRVSDQPEKCRLFNVDGRATGTLMPGKLYAASACDSHHECTIRYFCQVLDDQGQPTPRALQRCADPERTGDWHCQIAGTRWADERVPVAQLCPVARPQ